MLNTLHHFNVRIKISELPCHEIKREQP